MTTRDPDTWPAAHPRQLPRLPGAEAELAGTAVTAIPFLRHDCQVSVACRNLVDALVGKQLQSSQIAPAGAGVARRRDQVGRAGQHHRQGRSLLLIMGLQSERKVF